MSGVGEPKKSRNEDTLEDDHESDIENQESSNTPTLPGNDPTADARKPPTNGDEMPPKSTGNQAKGSAHSTPPRCDSPTLRKLLTSPTKSRGQSSLVVDELQGVGSEADMQEGVVPDPLQGSEAVGGDVPEAVHAAEVSKAVQGTEEASVVKVVQAAGKGDIPETKEGAAAAEPSILKKLLEAEVSSTSEAVEDVEEEMPEVIESGVPGVVPVVEEEMPEVIESGVPGVVPVVEEEMPEVTESGIPEPVQDPVVDEEMSEVTESDVSEVAPEMQQPLAAEDEVRQSTQATEKRSQTSESDTEFKKPTSSSRVQSMKGRFGNINLDDASVPDSPKRRSQRIEELQRAQSDSPSAKKERKSSRSSTPSAERMATRGQKGRQGSTSSNSEVEGSGDESRVKRVSRKDSRK